MAKQPGKGSRPAPAAAKRRRSAFVGDHREGEVQARQVEGLARRHEGDGQLGRAGRDERRRHVAPRLEEQVAVDLVGDEHQAAAAAEIDHGGDLVGAPDAPQRVVRVAEQQHPASAGVTAASSSASGSSQRPRDARRGHGHEPPPLQAGRLEEGRVGGHDGQHVLARARRRRGRPG